MFIIKSIHDLEFYRVTRNPSTTFFEYLEELFCLLYEASNDERTILQFRLQSKEAIVILEKGDDVRKELGNLTDVEYIEKEDIQGDSFYRIGVRFGDHIRLYYSRVGTHDNNTEKWLAEQCSDGGIS
jgi:hypothetical protein